MGWTMTLRLDADSLRTIKIPLMLLAIIKEDRRLHAHQHNLDLILLELMSNALEWGVLRLDRGIKENSESFEHYFALRQKGLNDLTEGWIKIDLEFLSLPPGGKVVVLVEDSGPGFNYQEPGRFYDNAAFGGRGIHRLRELCEELVYSGNGNCVRAVYGWKGDT